MVWWQNEAKRVVNGDDVAPTPPKNDKRGHPASARSWTPQSVCGNIFSDRVGERQILLSGGGETKDIAQYFPALRAIFAELSDDEREQCTTFAEEWNSSAPSEEAQRR